MAKSRIKKNTRVKQRDSVKKRKKEKLKRVLKGVGKLFLSFLIVAGLAMAGKKTEDFLLTSSYFQISEVSFEGLNSLKRETLESLAHIDLGRNIFQIDLEEIRERLESHPQVRRVIISRQFPQRVEVEVEEREAVALLKSTKGIYPLDAEGVILPPAPSSRPLPLIKGLDKRDMEVGGRVEEGELLMILGSLETLSSWGVPLSEIDMGEDGLVLDTNEVRIFLGRSKDDIEGELKKLSFILADLQMRKEIVEYIDLRFPNAVVKLREYAAG